MANPLEQYEKDALRTKFTLAKTTQLNKVADLIKQLAEIPEVNTFASVSKCEVEIFIDMESDYYHGRSPHMNHSWCHGWIVRGITQRIEDLVADIIEGGEPIYWQQVKWIPSGRRLVSTSDVTVGFELRKVPLHGE